MTDQSELQRITDKLAIHDLLAEYCLRLEVNSFDEWMDLFTEDTVYEVYKLTLKGRKEVTATLSQAPHGLHMGGPVRIEVNGDTAETIQNYLFLPAEGAKWNMGWYYRTVVRTPQGWKIAHTKVKMNKLTPYAAPAAAA